ncbi:MAG TPA: endonuclease V [Solirubrobacteraceae bacterium]|nr:endonuclease V [Solirubrobacteraceae bacterium]
MTQLWPTSPAELIGAQRALTLATPEPWVPASTPLAIGAVVVVFARHQTGRGARGDPAWAAAAVMRAATVMRRWRMLGEATIATAAAAPYEPGLLALREGPSLEAAVRALPLQPDVLLIDATGRDHPRRAGLALHLGAVTDLPTVGVTHRPLLAVGPWPADEAGAYSPLRLDGECVGAWVRTRAGARPLAVHPGWRTTLESAIEVVLASVHGHRTPEPIRRARHLARVGRAINGKHGACSAPDK